MKVTVDGTEYPFPERLTFRESNLIKRITGLRAGEYFAALLAGDTDMVFAYGLIARRRADPTVSEETLYDMAIEEIEIDLTPDTDDEKDGGGGPPAEARPDASGSRGKNSGNDES